MNYVKDGDWLSWNVIWLAVRVVKANNVLDEKLVEDTFDAIVFFACTLLTVAKEKKVELDATTSKQLKKLSALEQARLRRRKEKGEG